MRNLLPAYRRLSTAEREEISRLLAVGSSDHTIGAVLGRHPSTIAREVSASGGRVGYRAHAAQGRARRTAAARRRGRSKLRRHPALRTFVEAHLIWGWSPDQIAKRLRLGYPEDAGMRVAPQTIYAYVYVLPRGELKRTLIAGLRQGRKHRRPHRHPGTSETRGKLAQMLSIEERPSAVADRTVPGHWEGDLLLGKWKRSALGTLVERTTRFTLLVPLPAKDAASVRRAYARTLTRLPRHLAKTLTYDQGKEMSEHRQFTVATGIQVYFAHPGSPWERGTNENTNGLVRQYFPKGTDFARVSAQQIRRVQDLLNGRPRKSLGYLTPNEVFTHHVALEVGD